MPTSPLHAYGWNDRVGAALADLGDASLLAGRVLSDHRGSITVVTADRVLRVQRRALDVTTGDWVVLTPDEPAALAHVLPRWSSLQRHDADRTSTAQTLAANLDLCLVVVGLDRGVNARRLDRLLTIAWDSGATPVVVLTKSDLIADASGATTDLARLSVDVAVTSVARDAGVADLRSRIGPGVTAALVGESGAGKSSLINALAGTDRLATAEVRGDAKGRHTTRARQLVPVPDGGVLLDTPGIRAVGLTGEQRAGLDRAFADIAQLRSACRFSDCSHTREPGCAVAAAVEAGDLEADRLESYRRLQREQQAAERRADVRAARAQERRRGRQYKQVRDHSRARRLEQ